MQLESPQARGLETLVQVFMVQSFQQKPVAVKAAKIVVLSSESRCLSMSRLVACRTHPHLLLPPRQRTPARRAWQAISDRTAPH